MILILILALPVVAGLIAWALGKTNAQAARVLCLATMIVVTVLVVAARPTGGWVAQVTLPWIPQIGASFSLSMDGLSWLLVLLTAVLGIVAVVVSWTGIQDRVGFFHLNLMLVLAGVAGVFMTMDLFLLYFFWELMLVPMYFLIDLWGHENRHYAAVKFFIFTQLSGTLMLIGILGIYFYHGHMTGTYTFSYPALLGLKLPSMFGFWLMLGFFAAFAVKLPAVPLHTWLPDAHTEAPTAGSVILAGLLLKTGAYGMLRFLIPMFPDAAHQFAPVAMLLGVIGIVYGAIEAYGQTDAKRLVAYTSVSHLGFVLLGIFSFNKLAMQGAVMQMLAHGFSTGALFIIVGAMQERLHTRDMRRMGGLFPQVPRFGSLALFFAMASLGLPGLGNFVGEILVLIGAYKVSIALTAIAAVGLVFATVYSLIFVQRIFFGEPREKWTLTDLRAHEVAVLAAMVIALLWLGLFPMHALNMSAPVLAVLQQAAGGASSVGHAAITPATMGVTSLLHHLGSGGAGGMP